MSNGKGTVYPDDGGCATGFDVQELFQVFAAQPAGAFLSYLNGHASLLSLGVAPAQLFPIPVRPRTTCNRGKGEEFQST
jgi:hypothetical protein